MKLFSLLLLLIIMIEYVQSKKTLRTYIIRRDTLVRQNQLSTYTVYDKSAKNPLYLLKSTSTDIDTIIVTEPPATNMIANVEGEWIAKIYNVTFSIHDKKLGKWIGGTIKKDPKGYGDKYLVEWNSKHLNTKSKFFIWNKVLVYNTVSKELLAEIGYRDWFTRVNTRFTLKIYSNEVPDIIYFFLVAINDHRVQEATAD